MGLVSDYITIQVLVQQSKLLRDSASAVLWASAPYLVTHIDMVGRSPIRILATDIALPVVIGSPSSRQKTLNSIQFLDIPWYSC